MTREERLEKALLVLLEVGECVRRDHGIDIDKGPVSRLFLCALDDARAALAPPADAPASGRNDTPLHPEPHDGQPCGHTFGTKSCVRPLGHRGQHMSRSSSTWPDDVPVPLNLPPWRPTRDEYRAATERISPRPRIEQDDEPAETSAPPGDTLYIDYTDWRGQRVWRPILPSTAMVELSTLGHAQWVMRAIDVEEQAIRTFPLRDIHAFSERLEKGGGDDGR